MMGDISNTPRTSRGLRITVDDGRESFYALEISEGEDAWLISDTAMSVER